MREREETVAFAHLVLEVLDRGLEELDHAAALVADQVVVVLPRAQPLIPVAGLANAHASDDAGIDEQVERSVDRGPRDLRVLGSEPHEQLVGLEVLVSGEELVEEGLPFRRQLQASLLEVFAENRLFPAAHGVTKLSAIGRPPFSHLRLRLSLN